MERIINIEGVRDFLAAADKQFTQGGRENYIVNVSSGICTWCGFNAKELIDK